MTLTLPESAASADFVRTPSRPWHAAEIAAVAEGLGTSPENGLAEADAQRRLAEHGPNELREAPRPGFFRLLLSQFNNFIVLLLIGAAIVSIALGDYLEGGAILAIVVLNAVLGVVQEQRAEEALAALRRMAAPEAQVVRDGHRRNLPARELVPGDVVLLEAGNYIPADLRLIETFNLRIEEAALTGESHAVEKDARSVFAQDIPLGDRRNTAFMGTVVSYGRGRGVVIATGMRTQIGLIATMIQSFQEEPTPLQRKLDQLGKVLGIAAIVVCSAVFVLGWARGYPPLEMFLTAVSLAVAAVPEGLAAVVTITLAIGMREMIRRHALVRRLSSVETLGSTTVICSDKTGTLTQNQMTVTAVWIDGTTFEVGSSESGRDVFSHDGKTAPLADHPALGTALWVGVLANDAATERGSGGGAARVVGDPTETALILAAAKAGGDQDLLGRAYPRIDEIPFDSNRKRMTTVHRVQQPHPDDLSPFYDVEQTGWTVTAMKGAPDIVLDLCSHVQTMEDRAEPLTEDRRQAILDANNALTGEALRVLGVAFRIDREAPAAEPDTLERGLTFVGLLGMIDPARPEVPPALAQARRAGIRTLMITGDYPSTARAIAETIGLLRPGHAVRTGAEFEALSDDEARAEVVRTDVYARVSPEHKVRIVEALKATDEIVAMTGDGVNDAPALKRSDIGIAMGITGTDVAKETADMVLTDDNYASIVAAVEQGRVIYSNIRKFVFYLLSCNLAEIAVIFTATLAGLPSPLAPIQLLWLNLITDGAPALALGVEKGDPDTMDQPPRPPQEPVINRSMRLGIVVQTIAIAGVTLAAFAIGLRFYPEDLRTAETLAFVTLSASELLRAFTARSERYSLLRIGVFSNRMMLYAVTASLVLLLAVVYLPFLQSAFDTVPLTAEHWAEILPLLFIPAIVAEITKWFQRRAAAPAVLA
ncbi:MAG TPA: cation-translocating P-type ATPase [Anaerolineales bacterium]|nr:cation-translocating P-type ATPase [Anaerolineales bacterium]